MYISKPQARKRFDELCELKNGEMPFHTIQRKIERDGQEVIQTYVRQEKAICDGAQNTGKAILQSYAWQFKRLVNTLPAKMLNDEGMPSFKTNNEKMAKFRGNVSSRTIRNHLKQLKEVGLITAYKFHGSRSDFELWLCPEVLFGTSEMPEVFGEQENTTCDAPKYEKTVSKPPRFESDNDTKFPHRHIVSIETLIETKNTTTSKVENHSKLRLQGNGNKPFAAVSLPERQESTKTMETREGGGPQIIVDNNPKVWIKELDMWKSPGVPQVYTKLSRDLQHYIVHFWNYAAASLWPGKIFLPQEKFMTLDSITASVYQPYFSKWPSNSDLDSFHRLQLKAIDKAKKYYDKNPHRYPGDPFAKFKEGSGYFDQENSLGFKIAQKWSYEDNAANRERYGQKVLNDAIRHLKNQKSGKIPKKLQHLSILELYRHYETTIKMKFGNELLSEFYKQSSTLPILKK